jgi:hypothetical protein
MMASVVWYLAGALAILGGLFVIRPAKRFGFRSRRRAAAWFAAGLVVLIGSVAIGPREVRVAAPVQLIDRFVPVYQFAERHEIDVAATAAATYRSIQTVTPAEISFYRALTWIRRGGKSGPPSILDPPRDVPILKTAIETSFRKLGEAPDREIVFGGLVVAPPDAVRRRWDVDVFTNLADPGYAKVAMNFSIEPAGAGSRLRTETRVYATDAATRRVFTPYWRTIYPGSALIRWSWLRAVKARAEAPPR